jgi:hypothetical protein
LFLEGDSGLVEKKYHTINQNPTPAENELYCAICQRILVDYEKRRFWQNNRSCEEDDSSK